TVRPRFRSLPSVARVWPASGPQHPPHPMRPSYAAAARSGVMVRQIVLIEDNASLGGLIESALHGMLPAVEDEGRMLRRGSACEERRAVGAAHDEQLPAVARDRLRELCVALLLHGAELDHPGGDDDELPA